MTAGRVFTFSRQPLGPRLGRSVVAAAAASAVAPVRLVRRRLGRHAAAAHPVYVLQQFVHQVGDRISFTV